MPDTGSSTTTPGSQPWLQRCEEATRQGTDVTLTMHTRSTAPTYGTRTYLTTVRERVAALRDQGRIADVTVDVWGRHLEADGGRLGDDHEQSLAAYRRWGEEHGASLPFEERRCESMFVEDSYTVLVPPHVLVSLRDGGEILGVAPCSHGEGSTSVMDLLTVLGGAGRDDDSRASASA